VLEDNLGPDPTTADYGMVAMIVALLDAALHADQATMLNNTLTLALTREPGAILVYQVAASSVVGEAFQPDPSVPPRYYAYLQPAVDELTKCLHRVEQGRGLWSAPLPAGAEGCSTFDICMASFYPETITEVADGVTRGRSLRAKTRAGGKSC